MSWLARLAALWRPAELRGKEPEGAAEAPSGFMVFSHVGQVVAARKALLAAGLSPRIKAPPPALREGCDMVLEFPAEEEAVYLAVLEEKRLRPLKVMAADGPLTAPESLFKRLDFPAHLMVSAANLKITIERRSGRIVNVSGGGCPDVPHLAARLLGRPVDQVQSPAELSRSLCSFSLSQARDEAERLFKAGLSAEGPRRPADGRGLEKALPWPKKKPRAPEGDWLVVGTLPDPDEPLGEGCFYWEGTDLIWNGRAVEPERGTAALMAAYALAADFLGRPPGRAVLAGDDGRGGGSRAVYAWLRERIGREAWSGLTFHYLFPEAESHDRIFMALDEIRPRPVLAADAGFMYVAKLCGQAAEYDLFTPDAGEMAYLADPLAPHPFYTRGALIQTEAGQPLFAAAEAGGNAARVMLVKGAVDQVVWRGRVVHRVAGPLAPALEAVGGTGDTATGLASAFLAAGFSPVRAAALAAHLNRRAGFRAAPDPGSRIAEVIESLRALLGETRMPSQ
ncbi:MAG: DUF3343 domain-containing protein [Candidatus Adiutrix sp.]|nr:DUF3343 domain-containing protein [Candidatus Adiutrix sp.]